MPAPKHLLLQLPDVYEVGLHGAAQQLLMALPPGVNIVVFEGEMGAGKTTLIRQLCHELGVKDAVSSPTYALVNEYEGSDGRRICHFDFYRINSEPEAADIGTTEYFSSGDLCLVEWPSKIPSLLPEHYAEIRIEADSKGARTISLLTQKHHDTEIL